LTFSRRTKRKTPPTQGIVKMNRETVAPLSEPHPIHDTLVQGIADIEDIGSGWFRFTLYSSQKSLFDGSEERIVVARLIASEETTKRTSEMALVAVGAIPAKPCAHCFRQMHH
jgi:hypothetical protein